MTNIATPARPTVPDAPPSAAAGPGAPSDGGLHAGTPAPDLRRRVLVVDDDRDTLLSLKRYLEAHLPRTDVLTSRSPLDALDIVDQGDVRLVITDLRMPEMDGLEFWRRAREYRHDLVGMLVTAHVDLDLGDVARREGLAACLTKPFDMRRLRSVLSQMMESTDRPRPGP